MSLRHCVAAVRVVGGPAAVVIALVVAARAVAGPAAGTSYWVLGAAILTTATLASTYAALEPGWVLWRRTVAALAGVALLYPGWWALASLASNEAPGSRGTWFLAVLAGLGHLPVIASFSLVPLLAVRYLGRGSTRIPGAVVCTLGVAAAVTFVLFFGEFEPFEAQALVTWTPGETTGMTLNALFLGTVLVGPIAALLAAGRADGEAARRLALVAASALGGAALVMVCGALGSAVGIGGVVVLLGMYAALAVVVLGCTRALRLPGPDSESGPESELDSAQRLNPLTARESEVLALLAEGLSNAGIAAKLVLSERTVDAHLRSVFAKLDLPEGPLDNRRVHAVLAWRDAAPRSEAAS